MEAFYTKTKALLNTLSAKATGIKKFMNMVLVSFVKILKERLIFLKAMNNLGITEMYTVLPLRSVPSLWEVGGRRHPADEVSRCERVHLTALVMRFCVST